MKNKQNKKKANSLPHGWKMERLGDIAEIVSGTTPRTDNPTYWGGSIPWVTPRDLTGYSKVYIKKGQRNITEEGFKKSGLKLLPKGTLLLTSRAPIGYLAIAENKITSNQGFKNLILHEYNGVFVYYALKKQIKSLLKIATGSTFLEISGNALKKFVINLPIALTEQIAIAQVLSDVDNLVQAIDKLVTKKQQLKTATMQQLLTGKRRLVGFIVRWGRKKMSDFGEIITGNTPNLTKKEYWGGEIMWVTPSDINESKEIFRTQRMLTRLGLKVAKPFSPNTLLVTCIASIGKNVIIRSAGACNQQINAIVVDEKTNIDLDRKSVV